MLESCSLRTVPYLNMYDFPHSLCVSIFCCDILLKALADCPFFLISLICLPVTLPD